MSSKHKINFKIATVLIIIFVVILSYIIFNIYKLVLNPTNVFVVEDGTLALEETVECFVIRNETVLQGSNYKNGMYKIKSEGEKVANGGAVFRYYTKNEENLINKIAELDTKIDEAMQKESLQPSSDILVLESKIESEMTEVYMQNDISKIKQAKQEIEDSILKKAQIAGDLSPANSYIKKLIDERAGYENELNSGSETIYADESGIVSYKVDGMEKILTPDNFENLNEEFLNSLNLKAGQVISSSEECAKVVDNYIFYLACVMDSDKAKEAEIGNKIRIRLSTQEILKAEIVHINEEDGKRTIIFKTSSYAQSLISFRKMLVDIVWWSDTGLKVPNSAIIQENGLNYVVRNRAGYLDKILIKILRQNENYAIVDNYENEELKELGFSKEEILNMKSISIYDEIMLQ